MKKLDELLESAPDTLKHTFACDCAERALLRERENGSAPDPRSWRAVKIKRAWLEGNASDEALEAASSAAWSAARSAAWSAAWSAARSAARDAARSAARDAARDAARSAARDAARDAAWDEEQTWQLDHLQALLQAFASNRVRILQALNARKHRIIQAVQAHAEHYEHALF